jgi:hypothetical protein
MAVELRDIYTTGVYYFQSNRHAVFENTILPD